MTFMLKMLTDIGFLEKKADFRWWPFWKMAAMALRVQIGVGAISKYLTLYLSTCVPISVTLSHNAKYFCHGTARSRIT